MEVETTLVLEVMDLRKCVTHFQRYRSRFGVLYESELIKRKHAWCEEFSMQCAINERTGNCVLKTSPFAVSQRSSEENNNKK